jgi:hypothetical protein
MGAETVKAALVDVDDCAVGVLVHHVEPRAPSGGCREAVLRALRVVAPDPASVEAIGHRVVHCGPFRESVVIDDRTEAALARFSQFAPRHNLAALEGIATTGEIFPQRPMVAACVFSTDEERQIAEETARVVARRTTTWSA